MTGMSVACLVDQPRKFLICFKNFFEKKPLDLFGQETYTKPPV